MERTFENLVITQRR